MTDDQIDQVLRDLHGMDMIAVRCATGAATTDDAQRLREISERMTACLQWQRQQRAPRSVADLEASDGG